MWLALDSDSKRILDWELGDRSAATLERLYQRLKSYQPLVYCTDYWRPYQQVIPDDLLKQSKRYTVAIERANSNLRHYFSRFNRRCKSFSRALDMAELTVGLFATLNNKTLKK